MGSICRSLALGLGLGVASFMGGCTTTSIPTGPMSLNSRYTESQPALSGNGRFLIFVSNRSGSHNIWMYDLQERRFVDLPGLNRPEAIASSPSTSNTGRYLVYLTSDQGRPAIVLYDRLVRQSRLIYEAYQGSIRNPSISPNGRYIVFESAMRGQWDIGVIDRGPNIELDLIDGIPSEF